MFVDCHHVCKTCIFHDALQVGKKERIPQAPDQGSMVDDQKQVHLKSIMKCARFADVAAIQNV
jgi:hypothetical protein